MNEIINLGNGAKVKVTMLKGESGNDIQSVEKTATQGLVDTYTITLTDGTTHNFNVTNGRAITSVEKTSSVGFVDTYTITFNDGTTETFEVKTATITVDASLSTTSTNPVENRVISAKINDIESDIDAVETKADLNITNINNVQSQLIQLSSIESTSTASKSYADGKFLTLNGLLRKVTSPIAQGDTINNSNSEITTVSEELTKQQYKFEQRLGNIGFYFESKVVTMENTSDAYKVYTDDYIQKLFDDTRDPALTTSMFVSNGDTHVMREHITGCSHVPNSGWYVTFGNNVPQGNLMRLNILLLHVYS